MTRTLVAAGCVAADEEAAELVASAPDADALDALVARRVSGEPLAWLTGTVRFCGIEVAVDPGVYVPRWQSEALAERASALLPDHGTAVDLATGSGGETVDGEVTMQLNHGVSGIQRCRAIHLNLVVILSASLGCNENER